MPYVNGDGARIYWDEQGEGEPLLLIMGLGCASELWFRTVPELSPQYRIILFDNRGVGRSDAPPAPYSIAGMADDAAAVLEAAGVDSAHVFGYSMGGMIAQELALRHPRRVRSLILGSTHCGGENAVHPAPEVFDALMARGAANPAEAFWMMTPFMYDPATPREKLEEDLEVRSRAFPCRESYMAQLQAIMEWESHPRLSAVKVPTLVIYGETDRLIPPDNAAVIAGAIPGAKLVKLAGASHVFMTDQPQQAVEIILQFLQEASGRRVGAGS